MERNILQWDVKLKLFDAVTKALENPSSFEGTEFLTHVNGLADTYLDNMSIINGIGVTISVRVKNDWLSDTTLPDRRTLFSQYQQCRNWIQNRVRTGLIILRDFGRNHLQTRANEDHLESPHDGIQIQIIKFLFIQN